MADTTGYTVDKTDGWKVRAPLTGWLERRGQQHTGNMTCLGNDNGRRSTQGVIVVYISIYRYQDDGGWYEKGEGPEKCNQMI